MNTETDSGLTGAPLSYTDEREIASLIYDAASAADEQRYLDWMDQFADDGEYSVITSENLAYKGLRLCRDVGKAALHERVAFLMGMIQTPRGKTLRIVGNVQVTRGPEPNLARSKSNFIVTRTAEGQHSQLYAAGRYLDLFQRGGKRWLFKERLVVLDSNLLPAEFSELL